MKDLRSKKKQQSLIAEPRILANMTDIEKVELVENFLSQFNKELPDRYLALHLIRKLRYVSFTEFERWVQQQLENTLNEIVAADGRVAVAVFPVTKSSINRFNSEKEVKATNDSSGRIGHILKNIERDSLHRFELSPRKDSMRKSRVRHIIFVDDLIGTGDRFVTFWNDSVDASIKSWCSLGWCQIWILSFAGQRSGVNRILGKIRPAVRERIKVNLLLNKSFIEEFSAIRYLLYRYGELCGIEGGGGYGGSLCPVVFQHGCPNNVPILLWQNLKKDGKHCWNPLFPNRSIPEELYFLFEEDLSKSASSEELWMAGYYNLALKLLGDIDSYHGKHDFLVLLGYLNKSADLQKIQNVMVLSDGEFGKKIKELIGYGLINKEYKVTQFGRDVLVRGGRSRPAPVVPDGGYTNYYPSKFLGFQREV